MQFHSINLKLNEVHFTTLGTSYLNSKSKKIYFRKLTDYLMSLTQKVITRKILKRANQRLQLAYHRDIP